MAAVYYFPSLVLDPSTNRPLVDARGASGTIVALGDTTDTPLTLTDAVGVPLPNPVTATSDGFLPGFYIVEGLTRAEWVSGDWRIPIASHEGLEQSATAAAASAAAAEVGAAAQVAQASTYAAQATTAAESAAAAAGAAEDAAAGGVPLDADTVLASFVSDPDSLTGQALASIERIRWFDETSGTWPARPAGAAPGAVTSRSRLGVTLTGPADALPLDVWEEIDF